MHKGLTFSDSLQPMKNLEPCLPKGNLLDTTILMIYIDIKIGLL